MFTTPGTAVQVGLVSVGVVSRMNPVSEVSQEIVRLLPLRVAPRTALTTLVTVIWMVFVVVAWRSEAITVTRVFPSTPLEVNESVWLPFAPLTAIEPKPMLEEVALALRLVRGESTSLMVKFMVNVWLAGTVALVKPVITGGSFTGVTVSLKEAVLVHVPSVRLNVMTLMPDKLLAGVINRVRADPVPPTVRLVSRLAGVLLAAAVIVGVPMVLVVLKGTVSGVSSGVVCGPIAEIVGQVVVIITLQPPEIEPPSGGVSSTIKRDQVPFGSVPLKALKAAPYGPAGAGAANKSAPS